MQPLNDLNNMYFFASVVDAGGFSAAARDLGLQASALSRRISALEQELEVRLLNRNSRSISLTEPGKAFLAHCRAVLAEAHAARDTINQALEIPKGLVRMSCPIGLLHSGVSGFLARFLEKNPRVDIFVDATNRRVDVLEEGYDISLRVRRPPLENSALAMRTLAMAPFALVASPWLVKQFGPVKAVEDLNEYPTVAITTAGERHTWQFTAPDATKRTITPRPRLMTEDLVTLRDSVLAGIGAAHLPKRLVHQELASGELVQLLPDWTTQTRVIHAVFPSRKGILPAVRILLDALAEDFREGRID
jgi:DNA-binding transcriptional LysR family regulator